MTLPGRAGDKDPCRSDGPEGLTGIYLLGLVQSSASAVQSAECTEENSAECIFQCRVMFRVQDKCISEHRE